MHNWISGWSRGRRRGLRAAIVEYSTWTWPLPIWPRTSQISAGSEGTYTSSTTAAPLPPARLTTPIVTYACPSRTLKTSKLFFTKVQLNDRGNVNRTFPQVVADVAKTWRELDHERCRWGHWETGLANKLDGTEDKYIAGEAREI